MTTTIVPGSGQAPLFTQQGPGTTPGYSALDDRRSNSASLQEGVVGTSTLVTAGGVSSVGQADFMVTQRAAGANLSVDVNMPGGGGALVQGDTISNQGLYYVPVHASNINEAIATADATNPRIDQVILEIQDNVLDASGGNLARTRVLTGTPTGGATLANRNGAAALPGSALLLADVLVGTSVGSVGNAVIRDRRKWARGACSNVAVSSTYTTASTTFTLVDSTLLQKRIECSGTLLRVVFTTTIANNTAGDGAAVDLGLDGTAQAQPLQVGPTNYPANMGVPMSAVWILNPAAGSHLIGPMFRAALGGTAVLATGWQSLTIEEIVRQQQVNNLVTSG